MDTELQLDIAWLRTRIDECRAVLDRRFPDSSNRPPAFSEATDETIRDLTEAYELPETATEQALVSRLAFDEKLFGEAHVVLSLLESSDQFVPSN